MRRQYRAGILLLILMLMLSTFSVFADSQKEFDEEYYRFNDFEGVVTEEHEKELNRWIDEKIVELKMDFPASILKSIPDSFEASEYAEKYYAKNKFGYGEEKSGIYLQLNMDTMKFGIYYYGEAKTLITDEADQALRSNFIANAKNPDLTYYDLFVKYYEDVFNTVETLRKAEEQGQVTPAPVVPEPDPEPEPDHSKDDNKNGMPYWYAEDPASFQNFHGTDLPRVVDDMGLLTEKQLAELTKKVEHIVDTYGISYVIFIDDNTYRLSKEVYSADFLYYNGYGFGDDYSAVVFFLCLQEGNRGWRTTSTNSLEKVFNANITYQIDETVDKYMRSGEYYKALTLQADFIENMFASMTKNVPDYYPKGVALYDIDRTNRTYAAQQDPSKPCLVDLTGKLDEETKTTLSEKLDGLSEKYGNDLLVLVTDSTCYLTMEDYLDDYYYYNGYSKDGIACLLNQTGPYSHDTYVKYYGTCKEKLDLDFADRVYDEIYSNGLNAGAKKCVDILTYMLRWHKLPLTSIAFGFSLMIGFLPAWFVHAVCRQRVKKNLEIKGKTTAVEYLVPGSYRMRHDGLSFLYSTVSSRKKIKVSDSGGSGGGRSFSISSFSSGHASSGGSYSSGGRDF